MRALGIINRQDFGWYIPRLVLEDIKLVDSFRDYGYSYGNSRKVFKKILKQCRFAPMAEYRAKVKVTDERNSNAMLHYFSQNDETPEQIKYLESTEWPITNVD